MVNITMNYMKQTMLIKNNITIIMKKNGVYSEQLYLRYYSHHLCHSASAHYCSGYEDSMVFVNDGVGEVASSTLYYADKEGEFEELAHVDLPHTLGGLYASITEFLGFRAYMDEGKTMGLAAYRSEERRVGKMGR